VAYHVIISILTVGPCQRLKFFPCRTRSTKVDFGILRYTSLHSKINRSGAGGGRAGGGEGVKETERGTGVAGDRGSWLEGPSREALKETR
jgi:hypothetical protein